jgi:RNA polymerase sigma-70 factor (ECF subfamily)
MAEPEAMSARSVGPMVAGTSAPPRTSARVATDDEEHEAALLRRAASGDHEAAMDELYTRYAPRLFGYGMRSLRDRGLAEELVQECFVRLWRASGRFDATRGSVSRYLFTIARNTAIDLYRKAPRNAHVQLDELADESADAFDALVTALTVRDALCALAPAFREVLELTYDESLSQAQISDRLDVPVGTVKSRTYYALRALRDELTERGIDGRS